MSYPDDTKGSAVAAERSVAAEADFGGPVSAAPATEVGLVRAHGLAALAMVLWSALLGTAVALKFHLPELMGRLPWLTWGRLRYAHTQGIFFGWLGNAFLMFLYHAVPRLAGRPVVSRRLGWLLFFVWNFLVVIPGWVLVMAGLSQPLEWAEFPIIVDVFVVLAFVLMLVQFVVPFFRTGLSDLYVSAWYIMGAIVFTMLAYPVGNFVPELVPGARGATYSGLWIHDAVGLYVTPFAVAIAYFVIPAATGRPIYSHFLSMVAFWMLFFVYPLNGTHHFIFSSIPMEAQVGAVVASVYLGMDVVLNVTNQLLSLRGSAGKVAADPALRYTWAGIVCYLVVSLQGSFQALMPVNRFVHFTDWVIGHAHLAMIGFASFAAIGGMLHVWQRTPGVRYSARAANWSFWLLSAGLLLMVLDLTAAGLVQGHLWQSEAPWMDSVRASRIYWIMRSVAAVPLLLGFVALGLSMLTGPVGVSAPSRVAAGLQPADSAMLARSASEGAAIEARSASEGAAIEARSASEGAAIEARSASEGTPESAGYKPAATAGRWLRGAYVYTGVAGVGFFLFSFIVLAVWPNRALERQVAESKPKDLPLMTASERRGQAIYGREGCVNCHTQLVRFTLDDVRRFGPASEAWESERDYPQLWGTRRIGPDLAREHGRRPRDWQLAHLWNPRHVVPDSMMPGYPWLFDGSAKQPRQEALDLVAYLEWLGRAGRVAGLADRPKPPMGPAEEERMGIFCDCALPRTAGPPVLLDTLLPTAELRRFRLRGEALFGRHCSGCHGPTGRGDGPAAEALLPAPRDLATAHFSDRALSRILWAGVPGSSMPAWNELPANDLRALAVFVRSLDDSKGEASLKPEELTRARPLFTSRCISCHGVDGRGDGPAAASQAPRAANFEEVRPTRAYAEAVLARGAPGTAMPRWEGNPSEKGSLTAEERRLLARYVRTLYRESGR